MKIEVKNLEISNVQFIGSSALMLTLSNERTFIVPLDKFQEIAHLSLEERKNFEVIDGEYLSFLSIDEVYSIEDLIGI
jgi:hypothetical protein